MAEAHLVLQQKRFAPVLAVLGVAILASFLLFWKLGIKPLENWDEGIHAEVSREMYRNGAWLSLSYRDELYTAKPPLKFWLTTPLFAVMGETELAVRWWSAVAGVATVMLLAIWAWQWSRSPGIAVVAGAVFLVGRFVLFHAFRTGETDGLLVLFIVGALYAYWRSTQNKRWFIVFGILSGLAFMTKSFAGLIPAIVVGLDLTLSRRWSSLDLKTLIRAAAWFLVIVVPWHALELLRHGGEFWNAYFGFHIVERSTDLLYANEVPWWWYLDILARRTFPFSVFVPIGVILGIRRVFVKRDALDRLLLLWFAVVLVLFTVVKTKFDWYLLPIYPAYALLLARWFADLLRESSDRLTRWGFIASAALGVAVLPLGIAHEGILWKLTPFAYLPAGVVSSAAGRLMVGVVVAGMLVLIGAGLRNRIIAQPERMLSALVIAYFLVVAFGWQVSYLRHLPTSSPLKEISQKVETVRATALDVIGFTLETQPAGYFYLRRIPWLSVREVKTLDDLTNTVVLTTLDPKNASIRERGDAILERGNYILIEQRERPTI